MLKIPIKLTTVFQRLGPLYTVNSSTFLPYSNCSSYKNIILSQAMLPGHRVYLQSVYNVWAMWADLRGTNKTCEPQVEPNPKADPHQSAFLEKVFFNDVFFSLDEIERFVGKAKFAHWILYIFIESGQSLLWYLCVKNILIIITRIRGHLLSLHADVSYPGRTNA